MQGLWLNGYALLVQPVDGGQPPVRQDIHGAEQGREQAGETTKIYCCGKGIQQAMTLPHAT